jgi:hypothetical protein
MREYRNNGADLDGRFRRQRRIPGGRVKMFDKKLVHAIVGGKDPDRCSAESSLSLRLSRCHGSALLAPYYS